MATNAQLQLLIQRRLIDVPTSVTTEIQQLINSAIRTAEETHNFKVMEASQAYTTTTGSASLGNLPSDWKSRRGEPYLRLGQDGVLGDRAIGYATDRQQIVNWYDVDNTNAYGEPEVLLETATAFEVYPVPDANSQWTNGLHRVVVPYWKYLTDLSADANTNWFTTTQAGIDYIVDKATGEAFLLNWDETRAQLWLARAEGRGADGRLTPASALARLIAVDRKLSQQPNPTFRPRPGPYGEYHPNNRSR